MTPTVFMCTTKWRWSLPCGEAAAVSHVPGESGKVLCPANAVISADEKGLQPRKFFIPVQSTLNSLLAREDTDNNMQITIDDDGPKVLCTDDGFGEWPR